MRSAHRSAARVACLCIAGVSFGLASCAPGSRPVHESPIDAMTETVLVAPPTGSMAVDRAAVQAACDQVRPGGTVQFAPGTYVLGAGVTLTVPDVTVLGHPEGTTLRGGDPALFDVDADQVASVVFSATGLYVQADRQTIRGLIFEHAWHGIVLGPMPTTEEEAIAGGPETYACGGHRIEGNTFRACANGLRMTGDGHERSVVRDNQFVDVFHAIGIYGAPVDFVDNVVQVEDPSRIPFLPYPGSAIIVGPTPQRPVCEGHVIARNSIGGHPDAIFVLSSPGLTCRHIDIQRNQIHVRRVDIPAGGPLGEPTPTTMMGSAITLMNSQGPPDAGGGPGTLSGILIEENEILGGEGFGIELHRVSGSSVVRNQIWMIKRREPFPGRTWWGGEHATPAANGSGIWLSPGSTANEVIENGFFDNATCDVFIEGHGNVVAPERPTDLVRDEGVSNDAREPRTAPR